jgi:signal transduction histidine kinase
MGDIGGSTSCQTDTGMEMRDLLADPDFPLRNRGSRPSMRHLEAVTRLAAVFADAPQLVLQELVEIAVSYCGADSAGISLEVETATGEKRFRWVAIAGSFAQYVGATTPRFFSPCGTCLDVERAQLYRVTKPYYDFLGVTAEEITDGMLIPWVNEYLRGTIWAVAHHSREAFDMEDYRLLSTLAAFASMALRHQHQQKLLQKRERQAASAARSNELAHLINNPLQGLVNTLYLARHSEANAQHWIEQAQEEVAVLSELVDEILKIDRKLHTGLTAA